MERKIRKGYSNEDELTQLERPDSGMASEAATTNPQNIRDHIYCLLRSRNMASKTQHTLEKEYIRQRCTVETSGNARVNVPSEEPNQNHEGIQIPRR